MGPVVAGGRFQATFAHCKPDAIDHMAAPAPLQLLLFRHPDDADVLTYEEAIVRAFQGGKEAAGYLATGEDLGVQLEVFSRAPRTDWSAALTLDSFGHTFTIVLVDHTLLTRGGESLWDWLAECWRHTDASNG